MKYLFLAYGDEQLLATMSANARTQFEQAALSNNAALRASGRLLAEERLNPSHSAMTVRVQQDIITVSAGTVATPQSQLMGIYLIDARDLNAAIQVAVQMPQAYSGPIEVHPLLEQHP